MEHEMNLSQVVATFVLTCLLFLFAAFLCTLEVASY